MIPSFLLSSLVFSWCTEICYCSRQAIIAGSLLAGPSSPLHCCSGGEKIKAFIFCPEAPSTPGLLVFQEQYRALHIYDDVRVYLSRNCFILCVFSLFNDVLENTKNHERGRESLDERSTLDTWQISTSPGRKEEEVSNTPGTSDIHPREAQSTFLLHAPKGTTEQLPELLWHSKQHVQDRTAPAQNL